MVTTHHSSRRQHLKSARMSKAACRIRPAAFSAALITTNAAVGEASAAAPAAPGECGRIGREVGGFSEHFSVYPVRPAGGGGARVTERQKQRLTPARQLAAEDLLETGRRPRPAGVTDGTGSGIGVAGGDPLLLIPVSTSTAMAPLMLGWREGR